jgi:hypothetical protein
VLKAIDGGLACNACKDHHAKNGCSNPGISFLVDWSISIKKCIEHCTREALAQSDIEDVESFVHTSDSSFNERGIVLKKEASAQLKYTQRMRKLAKIGPTGSINIFRPNSVSSPKSFFLIAHELYLKNPTFRKSILTALLHSMVTQLTNLTKSPKLEPHALNFLCYILYHLKQLN